MTFEAGRYVLAGPNGEYVTSWDTIEEVKAAWPKDEEEAKEFFKGDFWVEDTGVDWGEYQGKKRRPCPELPELLLGLPIGQYHCPYCGVMCLAGIAHMMPDEVDVVEHDGDDLVVPTPALYENFTGQEWPPGYIKEDT